jgi:putative thioredoxin
MPYISDATDATFDKEVIERSSSTVVLVDFWAEWCQPCRMLGPLLEAAVEAHGGEVWLVKVNTDLNRELAVRYRIQGIPAVKAFVDGKVAGEFVGVRDRRAIDAFITQVSPSKADRALGRAEALLADGQLDQIEPTLGPALESPHHQEQALLILAKAQLAQREFDRARQTLDRIPDNSLVADQVDVLQIRIEMLSTLNGTDEVAQRRRVEQNPDDLDARWVLASLLLASGRTEEALDTLLALMQRSRVYRGDGARRAMLAIFDELGPNHDLSREFRRRMQIYL